MQPNLPLQRALSRGAGLSGKDGSAPRATQIKRLPLSAIIKEMASTLLRDPTRPPSPEAAHAALLLAHVAWNRQADLGKKRPDYRLMLHQFEASKPDLWAELTSADPEELIARLAAYRDLHHSEDRRYLLVCGMRDEEVYAEWHDPS